MTNLTQFDLHASPGVLGAKGMLRLLNDAKQEPWTIMLREAVQNSWDARKSDEDPITFGLRARRLTLEQVTNLETLIGNNAEGSELCGYMRSQPEVMEIYDSNTYGLTGATGFDTDTFSDVQNRYLKFIYEVGSAQEAHEAGGSYGFGKVSFFRYSKTGLICAYSRIKNGDHFENRLVFKCVNKVLELPHYHEGVIWWGDRFNESNSNNRANRWVEPVTGDKASQIWESIGGKPFGYQETGTKIIVFNPEMPDFSDQKNPFHNPQEDNMRLLANEMTHYFWAKWPGVSQTGGIIFKAESQVSGGIQPIQVPDPAEITPYKEFIKALNSARAGERKHIEFLTEEVKCLKPLASLGFFSFTLIPATQIDINFADYFSTNSSDGYVALMRNVEFVVNYFNPEVRINQNEETEGKQILIGVFRTLQGSVNSGSGTKVSVNEVFRNAESQTHGDWNPHNATRLGRYAGTYIRSVPKRINEQVRSFIKTRYPEPDMPKSEVNTEFMSFLGSLTTGLPGGPARQVPDEHDSGSRTLKPRYSFDTRDVNKKEDEIVIESVLEGDITDQLFRLKPVCSDEDSKMRISSEKETSQMLRLSDIDLEGASVEEFSMNNILIRAEADSIMLCISVTPITKCIFEIQCKRA